MAGRPHALALDHPHIVTIYDIAEVEGQHFIVMQYVTGRTLRRLLARGPPQEDRGLYVLRYEEPLGSDLIRLGYVPVGKHL